MKKKKKGRIIVVQPSMRHLLDCEPEKHFAEMAKVLVLNPPAGIYRQLLDDTEGLISKIKKG